MTAGIFQSIGRSADAGHDICLLAAEMPASEINPLTGVVEMSGDSQCNRFLRHRAMAQWDDQAQGEGIERPEIPVPEVRQNHGMQHHDGPPTDRPYLHEAVAPTGPAAQAQGPRSGRELPQQIVEVVVLRYARTGKRSNLEEDARERPAGDLRLRTAAKLAGERLELRALRLMADTIESRGRGQVETADKLLQEALLRRVERQATGNLARGIEKG
nr:hypothetical protein [Sinorhizobium meliloti]